MLLDQQAQEIYGAPPMDMNFLALQGQSTLTSGTWSELDLTCTVPADGVYIARLFANTNTGGATINWADFSVV
jgi:hypothetical protein